MRTVRAAIIATGIAVLGLGALASTAMADSVRITSDSVRITDDSVRITDDSDSRFWIDSVRITDDSASTSWMRYG